MYNHNKAQQSKNRVHISWDILYMNNRHFVNNYLWELIFNNIQVCITCPGEMVSLIHSYPLPMAMELKFNTCGDPQLGNSSCTVMYPFTVVINSSAYLTTVHNKLITTTKSIIDTLLLPQSCNKPSKYAGFINNKQAIVIFHEQDHPVRKQHMLSSQVILIELIWMWLHINVVKWCSMTKHLTSTEETYNLP